MDNRWIRVKLDELIRVKHGYAFKGKYFSNQGNFILLTPGNFSERDGLVLKGEKEKYYIRDFPEEYVLKKGDLLIAMTDLKQTAPYLGAPALIDKDNLYLHNQRLGLIETITDKIDKGFLYWLFQTNQYRSQIKGSATGTTVRHTAPERIYNVSVSIPENVAIQRTIAATLNNYDLLIKNNTRRIQQLEHLAKVIYDQWFKEFKFTGHEKRRKIDSELGEIPEGWTCGILGDICKNVNRSVRPQEVAPDTPYVGLEHITRKHLALKDWGIAKDVISNKCLFYRGEILFGKLRPYFHKVAVAPINGVCSTDILVLCSINPSQFSFVLYTIFDESFIKYVSSFSSGTRMPRTNWKDMSRFKIVLPPPEIIEEFELLIKPVVDSILLYSDQSRALANSRDILLSKLLSGELDVV